MEHLEQYWVSDPNQSIQYPRQLRHWDEDKWARNITDAMPDELPLPKATVHGSTGTLCVHGIRLTSLTKKFKRSHFSTHAIFMGDFFSIITPHNSRFGDCIYFLSGFDVPVALRPAQHCTHDELSRNDLFTFVGLCHVETGRLTTLQGSDSKVAYPDDLADISQWTVLHGSADFLGGLRTENTQALHLKLAEMCSTTHEQYSSWQITFTKILRERVGLIWDEVLDRFKKQPFPLADASDRYHWRSPGLLEDLIDGFEEQSNFWTVIVDQLVSASMSSDEETKQKLRQLQQGLQSLRKNMRILSASPEATEAETVPRARLSEELDMFAKDRLLYAKELRARGREGGDRYCPKWYQFTGASFYWYSMRYTHADKAADYIEQALAYMDIAHTGDSNAAAAVLRANIDAATAYRRATRIASMEVKLTAKSLKLPIFETDAGETMDDWQKIFII